MARRGGPSALNALIAVNKPAGMTSHDVVAAVRRAVGEKRVGHAGTLDPAATGVLVVGIGQATKLLGLLTLDRKGYRATIQFGAETTTDDAEGEVVREAEVPGELMDACFAAEKLAALVGDLDQVPPAYSAVSVGGVRAYAAARAGEELELEPRRVHVYGASLSEAPADGRWVVDLDVSKGTYVRSIARDLGRELGCYAHVAALGRTFAGSVTLADCVGLDELAAGGADLVRECCLDPVRALGLPRREVELAEVADVMNGRSIELGAAEDRAAREFALTFRGGLVGVWERRSDRLFAKTNFPQAVVGVSPRLGELSPESALRPCCSRALVLDALGWGRGVCAQVLEFSLLDGVAKGAAQLPGALASVPVQLVGDGAADALDAPDASHADQLLPDWFLGDDRRFVCAVGAFDGFHRGHRALLARARAEADARGARLAAVTFSPDPARVLGGAGEPSDLLSVDERQRFLLEAGVDLLITIDFTPELSRLGYLDFIDGVLRALVHLEAVVVGSDFRFGAGGAGTVEAIRAAGAERGFDVVGMRLADAEGSPITATRIRGLLREGRVEAAAALLGRCHYVRGGVVHGRGEGAGFGFPTANVEVDEGLVLPAEGVYAGYVVVGREAYPAAVNVGRPRSFGDEVASGSKAFLEPTLLGFDGDLYGKRVTVVFVRWLREPRVFPTLDELEKTVLANVDWVRSALGESGIEL